MQDDKNDEGIFWRTYVNSRAGRTKKKGGLM